MKFKILEHLMKIWASQKFGSQTFLKDGETLTEVNILTQIKWKEWTTYRNAIFLESVLLLRIFSIMEFNVSKMDRMIFLGSTLHEEFTFSMFYEPFFGGFNGPAKLLTKIKPSDSIFIFHLVGIKV